ncbi:MAG: hypothetical protein KDK00_13005 [Rhodobacteraceae bacterium]|nr:hypothetical protein [Paracoccaceae bacterium]
MAIRTRLTLLILAGVMLYAGPFLAAWSGQNWRAVPVFALLFLLYMALMRPSLWPRNAAEARDPGKWRVVAGVAMTQAVLVYLCMLAGWLAATFRFPLTDMHPALPVGLSALAIALGRAVWMPEGQTEELKQLLEETRRHRDEDDQ